MAENPDALPCYNLVMEKRINKDKYQVFLFTCPANLPFSFGRHPWFVVNMKGDISRWEVLWENEACPDSWGHLHRNMFPPFKGIGILPFYYKILWPGKYLGHIEGDENSVAKRMADFILNSPKNYPLCNNYRLSGPNSNTYGQWILNRFPEFKAKLQVNAIGKKYKVS